MITVGITIGRSNEVIDLPNHMSLKSLKIKNNVQHTLNDNFNFV